MRTEILDELEWRGLSAQSTDRDALRRDLAEGMLTLYAGFDPTAPSLHAGNLVQLLTLRRFQQAGARPIVLAGGATEFSYLVLQSQDCLHLFRRHGCRLQIGGSGQWATSSAGWSWSVGSRARPSTRSQPRWSPTRTAASWASPPVGEASDSTRR